MIKTQKHSLSKRKLSISSIHPKTNSQENDTKQNACQKIRLDKGGDGQIVHSARLPRRLRDSNGRRETAEKSRMNKTNLLYGFKIQQQEEEVSRDKSQGRTGIKSQRKLRDRSKPKVHYNYTHNISNEIKKQDREVQATKKSRQVTYQLQTQHIENMHQQIEDLLRAINKQKQDREIQRVYKENQTNDSRQSSKYNYLENFSIIKTESVSKAQQSRIEESLVKEYGNGTVLSVFRPGDQQIYNDFLNQYRRQKEKQPESKRQLKIDGRRPYEQSNSEYVEVIDKEILRIKDRILTSERMTKEMEVKYLARPQRTPQKYEVQRQIEPSPHFLYSHGQLRPKNIGASGLGSGARAELNKIITYEFQIQTIRESLSQERSAHDSILKRLAMALSDQVETDLKMRQWRQFAVQFQGTQVWHELSQRMRQFGLNYSQKELQHLLQINSSESDPFNSNRQTSLPPLRAVLQNLSKTFCEAQQNWLQNVLGSINAHQAHECGFSAQFLDLNKKGHICLQDIVCFVNLYAGRFYRNRDFMIISRRILSEACDSKKITYIQMQAVIID